MNTEARTAPMPKVIRAHRVSRVLELVYTDGTRHELPFEFLRVYSPSAEVRGHGGGEPMPVPGKRNVGIERVETVGRYAVRLVFDDGHDSGLYTWDILDDLGAHQSEYWTYYLERLEKGGMSRDSGVVTLAALGPGKHHPAR